MNKMDCSTIVYMQRARGQFQVLTSRGLQLPIILLRGIGCWPPQTHMYTLIHFFKKRSIDEEERTLGRGEEMLGEGKE